MTDRRRALLTLLPLLFVPFLLGQFGPLEVILWLVLLASWLAAFLFWARPRATAVKPRAHG